ncbi:MAG: hypothetical protein HKO73_04165 [Woeseiaceae bacterium]|nr:hypothetical protein [Woeseiaceae bacterium]
MRARRDERKVIKEEYKSEKKMGKATIDDAEGDMDVDALETEMDDKPEDDTKKEKKPWWKFWNR